MVNCPALAAATAITGAASILMLGTTDVTRHTMQRLASLFGAAIGRRLTYKELIA